MKETHRGITTITNRKNERKPKTIRNRLGQLSVSLPRIDDRKRWSGFAGLTGIARKVAKLVPLNCKIFCEPFSGTAKVGQMVIRRKDISPQIVLNDKAQFIYGWLQQNFPNTTITNEDFMDCIKRWDSKNTVFLIDGPWYESYYNQTFAFFDRKSVREYDEQIISLCTGKPFEDFNKERYKIKGKFIIASRKENRVFLKSKFKHKLIKSEYVVSGKYPKVMITTNIGMK